MMRTGYAGNRRAVKNSFAFALRERGTAVLFPAIIIVIALFTILTIKASGKTHPISLDNTAAETEYVSQIREILADNNVKNAGVTLTKVSETGEDTDYTVLIHTRVQLSQDVISKLSAVRPDVERSTVSMVFNHR